MSSIRIRVQFPWRPFRPVGERIHTDRAPGSGGLYPAAVRVGRFFFLSGIGSRDPVRRTVPDSFEGQCRRCFDNVGEVLSACGLGYQHVVSLRVYLTDMDTFEAMNRVYSEYFVGEGRSNPARTTLGVSALPQFCDRPIGIEVEAVAALSLTAWIARSLGDMARRYL